MNSGSNNIQDIPIGEILPQRPPFVLVNQLWHYEENITVTRFTIAEENVFLHNGEMAVGGLVENFAQTCAARIGYYCKYVAHIPVSIGYVGAVKKLDVLRLPRLGETLETRIEVLSEQFGMTLAHGSIHLLDGTLIAEGEMTVALKQE